MKKWIIGKPDENASAALSRQTSLSALCSSVLVSRGIDTVQKACDFFNFKKDNSSPALSDPFLIKDMKAAADAILEAVDNGENICIYGDYDCDGITATTILYSYLECLGANVSYYINMRSDGYGLCENGIRKLADDGVDLIVSVDNGISAISEIKLANELGMKVVVTDHHQPGEELPNALAVVDPHRSDCPSTFKDLCGCSVALKLIAAMDDGDYSAALEQFSDFAALATIADVVPLTGENRFIVTNGLHYLKNTENPGLQSLIKVSGAKDRLSSVDVSFSLIPRINASGRFGSASDAVELFLTDDEERAQELADKLDRLNSERKAAEESILASIEERIKRSPEILYNRVLVIYGEGWHHGVIGIVCTRLVERFGKPVFLLSDDGEEARGSARSVEGFSIYEALSACSEYLTKFGGHVGAGGFSLHQDDIEKFNAAMQEYAAQRSPSSPVYTIHADKIILPNEITPEAIESLSSLEPFGECSRQPLFLIRKAVLTEIIPISGGLSTKIKINYGGTMLEGPLFGTKTDDFLFRKGDTLDLVAAFYINVFNGRKSINIRISDIRSSTVSQVKYFNAKAAYEQFKRGEGIEPALAKRALPTRDDLIMIYRTIGKFGIISSDELFGRLDDNIISYCKLRIAVDIFSELGFIDYDIWSDRISFIKDPPKAAIESSKIYQSVAAIINYSKT
ncbi:MAG: single-stranded-DNA-specific exonuclease RecJ [Oscillospiraceae bacterium]